jgi:hypothetical protein
LIVSFLHTPGSMRARACLLLALFLLAGCATGQGGLDVSAPDERLALARAECSASLAARDRAGAFRSGLEQGALASLYLIVRGAAGGAFWGAVTGGGAADGAWIGAVVGGGLGAIVGVVTGVERNLENRRQYRALYEICVAERVSAAAVAARSEY